MRFTGPTLSHSLSRGFSPGMAGRALRPAGAQAPPSATSSGAGHRADIKEYLLRNPEVLQEAIAELEKRQPETQQVAQARR